MNPVLGVLLCLLFVSGASGVITVYAAENLKKRRKRAVFWGCCATFFGGLAIAYAIGGEGALQGLFFLALIAFCLLGYAVGPRY